MNNKEKPQGLSAEDREIQMLVSTKQKKHSELTGLKAKLPRPCLPTGRHRTGLPGDVATTAGSALTPLRESVPALPPYPAYQRAGKAGHPADLPVRGSKYERTKLSSLEIATLIRESESVRIVMNCTNLNS